MKITIFSIVSLVTGLFIGWNALSVWLQLSEPSYIPDEINYESIFEHSSTFIAEGNFMCEGYQLRTVGAVLSSIFKANSNRHLNNIYESCSNGGCEIVYNSCKSWQSDSCGSTILKFSIDINGVINAESFQCLQVP